MPCPEELPFGGFQGLHKPQCHRDRRKQEASGVRGYPAAISQARTVNHPLSRTREGSAWGPATTENDVWPYCQGSLPSDNKGILESPRTKPEKSNDQPNQLATPCKIGGEDHRKIVRPIM